MNTSVTSRVSAPGPSTAPPLARSRPFEFLRTAGRGPLLAAAAATLLLAGCGRGQQEPAPVAEVEQNVAEARIEGQQRIAETQREVTQQVAEARAEGGALGIEERRARADAQYELAVAEAEAAHKVQVEGCAALAGEAQKACRDRADAQRELAEADARQGREATRQQLERERQGGAGPAR